MGKGLEVVKLGGREAVIFRKKLLIREGLLYRSALEIRGSKETEKRILKTLWWGWLGAN